jgi:hypothetical protein
VRIGGSRSRGARSLQPAPPGLGRRRRRADGAAQLIRQTVDPGLLREPADQVLVDRLRGGSDCGGVHRVSEVPAARAVTMVPALNRHFRASPHLLRPRRALPAEAGYQARAAGALVTRDQL